LKYSEAKKCAACPERLAAAGPATASEKGETDHMKRLTVFAGILSTALFFSFMNSPAWG